MNKLNKKHIYRSLSKYHHSKTQSGFLYLFEKIIRSHPLLYYFFRALVRFTNIFEEDFNGIKLIKFRNKIKHFIHFQIRHYQIIYILIA